MPPPAAKAGPPQDARWGAPPPGAPPLGAPPPGVPPPLPLSAGTGAWQGDRPRQRPSQGCWRRSADDRLLGGVAGGISRRFGIDASLVRIAFALGTVFGGFGAAVYLGAWLLMPLEGHDECIGTRVARDRHGIVTSLAFVPALVIVLVIGAVLHAGVVTSAAWPLFLCVVGAVLLWRNVDPDEREWLRHAASPVVRLGAGTRTTRRLFAARIALGAGLVLGGVALMTFHHVQVNVARIFFGVVLLLAGVVVLFGPWWLHLARDLIAERQARVRAEERADMAARVHDSVLQTLALIQRAAGDPHRVVQLARGQERELRAWLFEGDLPGAVGAQVTGLAAGVRAIGAEVEAAHGVVVDVVVVGDCPLDGRLRALLDAAAEATVNAAKWSGAGLVSLFAEVEEERVSIFVRDRGKGFDVDGVGPDRRGIAQSIRARMLRHGGSALVRSAPGKGTEVVLISPRGGSR